MFWIDSNISYMFCPFYFGHCFLCPSIYGIWSPHWYVQTILISLYCASSLVFFVVFCRPLFVIWLFVIWPLYSLSFYLRLLIIPFDIFKLFVSQSLCKCSSFEGLRIFTSRFHYILFLNKIQIRTILNLARFTE